MKITYETKHRQLPFSEMKVGDIFTILPTNVDNHNRVYVKLPDRKVLVIYGNECMIENAVTELTGYIVQITEMKIS